MIALILSIIAFFLACYSLYIAFIRNKNLEDKLLFYQEKEIKGLQEVITEIMEKE